MPLAGAVFVLGFIVGRWAWLRSRPSAGSAERPSRPPLFALGAGLVGGSLSVLAYSSAADRSFLAWLAVVALPLGLLLLGGLAALRVGETPPRRQLE